MIKDALGRNLQNSRLYYRFSSCIASIGYISKNVKSKMMYRNYQMYRLHQYWAEVLEHFKALAQKHKCNDFLNICNQIEFDIPD